MSYAELVKIIQQKYTITEFSGNDIVLALKEVEQVIKNYCMIPSVPEALKFTWCNMTIDLLMYNYEINTKPDDVMDVFDPSDVSTLKVGDTTVSLGDKYRSNQRSRILQSHSANLDEIVTNYKAQLNQFRRLW